MRGWSRRALAVPVLLVALLSGCAPRGAAEAAAGASASAIQAARLAVDLLVRDRLPGPAAATTVDDALRKALDAESTVAAVQAPDPRTAALRDEAVSLTHEAVTTLVSARDSLDDAQARAAVLPALTSLGERLRDLDQRIRQAAQ